MTTKDPEKYTGSGKYWKNHLKIHSKQHVRNVWTKLFHDRDACYEFAVFFSEDEDIVNATGPDGTKKYANEKPETLDGGSIKGTNAGNQYGKANKGKIRTAEQRARISATNKARPPSTKEVRDKLSKALKGRTWLELYGEEGVKQRLAARRSWSNKGQKHKK